MNKVVMVVLMLAQGCIYLGDGVDVAFDGGVTDMGWHDSNDFDASRHRPSGADQGTDAGERDSNDFDASRGARDGGADAGRRPADAGLTDTGSLDSDDYDASHDASHDGADAETDAGWGLDAGNEGNDAGR